MMVSALSHLAALDLGWFIGLVMYNLHWIFMFAALVYIFFGGKNVVKSFLFVVFVTWVFLDFNRITGWVVFGAAFLMLHYMTKLAAIGFAEKMPGLKNRMPLVNAIQAFAILVLFNIFMR